MKGSHSKSEDNLIKENNISHNIKLYKLTTRYVKNFSADMINYLNSLMGKSLNELPFLGSYLSKYTAVLLNVEITSGAVRYFFDFNVEKIVFSQSTPLKKIIRNKVECCHYLTSNTAVIVQSEAIEDTTILSVLSLIPYTLVLKTSADSLPSYTPPRWTEINFSTDELVCIGGFISHMIKKEVTCCESIQELSNKIINHEEANSKSITSKPYRNNGFIISTKYEERIEKLILNIKGEIKANYSLPSEIISSIVLIANIIRLNNSSLYFLTVPEVTLNDYFNILHKDMFSNAKLKLEKRILEDFSSLLSLALNDRNGSCKLSYLSFTIAFNILLHMAVKNDFKESSTEDYGFYYESLSDFIILYTKFKHKILFKESSLNQILVEFIDLVKTYRGNIALFLYS